MKALGFEKEFVIVLEIESEHRFVIETLFVDTRTEERKELPFLKLLFLR